MHGCSVLLVAHVYRVSFLEDGPVVNETSGSVGQLGRQWRSGGERETSAAPHTGRIVPVRATLEYGFHISSLPRVCTLVFSFYSL